jgi:dTDP-4-amino-4,6-dideoxygalactose transaminase
MLNGPFSPWPSFSQQEADAVSQVLLSNKVNYWTGSECREFEKEFATWCHVPHAVALNNGTVALDLALKALQIGAGDEVIVTPRTFLASVSAIVTAGAIPIFAEVDRDSQNITPDTVAKVITPRTKAIIAVHLAGWPCDMDGLMDLAKQHDLVVIEDCAQAHGALWRGQPVGGLGHAAAWSFCQDKIMSTGGEGGVLTTHDQALWSTAWSYKDHGKSFDAVYNRQHAPGFRWLHESFGTNWRMLEMQGTIGRIQLQRMPEWHAARKTNALSILAACAESSALRVPEVPDYIEHAWYRAYVFVRPEKLAVGWNRDRIMNEIVARGVPCYSGSCSEVYLEKAFDDTNWRPTEPLPVARELGETSLMFLTHPTLTTAEIEKTCQVVRQVMLEAQI